MRNAAAQLLVVGVCIALVIALIVGGTKAFTYAKESLGWDSDTNRQIRIEKRVDELHEKVDKLVELGEKWQ